MPRFVYQARDASGERVSGAHEAATQPEALAALRAAGLYVTKLLPADSREAKGLFPNGAPSALPLNGANGTSAQKAAASETLPSKKWELAPEATPQPSTPLPEAASEKPLLEKPLEKPVVARPAANPHRTPPAPRRGEKPKSEVIPERPIAERPTPSTPPPTKPAPTVAPQTVPQVVLPSQASTPLPPRYHLRSNTKDLSLFWSQMHSMLEAGVSLSHAISTMAQNAPNAGLRAACSEIAPRVVSGTPLSELMGSYPGIFTPLMIGMIRAGEAGGFLDRMCKRLSQYSERDYNIQQTIKRETWYPKLLFVLCLMIPTIVPAAIAFFRDGQSFILTWLRAAAMPILILVSIGLVLRFKNFLAPLTKHLKPFQLLIDQVKLLIPISGRTTRALATAKFCRALGALQAAGMGVQQTINLSADACGNAVIAEHSRRAIRQLEGGASMTEALESTRQFPGVALQMLRTGEATGNFDEQLDKVADFLETDAETTIKQSVAVLGILAFLFMAIYIAINVIQQYVGTYTGIIDQGLDMQD